MPKTHLEYVVRCLRDAKSRIPNDHPAYLDIECAAGSLAAHLEESKKPLTKTESDVVKDLWTLYDTGLEEEKEKEEEPPKPKVKPLQKLCKCGRKEEEGAWGCLRFPACLVDDEFS